MDNLYFKLTTVPQTEDVTGKELELYFKKYQEANKLEDLNQAVEDYYPNAGKNPLFGKIYSITVGYVHDNKARISILKGEEKSIIQEFINITYNDYFNKYQISGWNFSFLLPFLRVRAKKNGIHQSFHKDCEDLNKKPWTISGLDLFDSWKGLGWYQSSLEEVAELTFNISTDFIDGKDVYNYYKEGKFEELDKSSISEMMALINVHRGIKGEDFVEEKSVDIKFLGDVQSVEIPILQKLYHEGRLTKEIKSGLKEQFKGKKKPTKKEKEQLFQILRGVYIQTDFINGQQDNKDTIKRKEEEIEELLEEFWKNVK